MAFLGDKEIKKIYFGTEEILWARHGWKYIYQWSDPEIDALTSHLQALYFYISNYNFRGATKEEQSILEEANKEMNEHIPDGRPTRTRSESGIIKENLKKGIEVLKASYRKQFREYNSFLPATEDNLRELIRYAEFIKKAYQDELTSQWLRLLNNRLNYANTMLKRKQTDKYKKCIDDILDALKRKNFVL